MIVIYYNLTVYIFCYRFLDCKVTSAAALPQNGNAIEILAKVKINVL